MRINLNPPADATAKNESTTFLMIRFAITYSVFLLIILLLMVHLHRVSTTRSEEDFWNQDQCSCSKFLSQILKIVVKNFSEIVPGKQTQKEGFRPLIFLTHSMRITLLIIIEFDPCIYAVKFNFIPFQVPLYQAADVIQNRT